MEKGIGSYIYSLIPISILRDNRLTSLEKLLLIQIISLCKQKGYCWATNKYFAELNNVSRTTISKSVNNIATSNYINIQYEQQNLNNSKRKIELTPVLNNQIKRIKESFDTSIKEKFKQYNKNDDNKIDKIYTKDENGNEYWHGVKIEYNEATKEEQEEIRRLMKEIQSNRKDDK